MLSDMNKIEELLTQFNGTTFASNEDATEHMRLAIKRLMEDMSDAMIGKKIEWELYNGNNKYIDIEYEDLEYGRAHTNGRMYKRNEIIKIAKEYV